MPSAKIGGATPRTFKLTDHAIALLPAIGDGNATSGIEQMIRSLPSILDAYRELSKGSKRQQAIADRMDEQLGLSQWDAEMKEVEILDAKGNVIGWIV